MSLPARALTMTVAAFIATPLYAAVTFLPLGNLDPAAEFPGSYANDISADGAVVVGTSFKTIAGMPETRAFRWTAEGGMVALNPPPLGLSSSMGLACSGNGAVVAGATGFVVAGTSFYEIRNGTAWLDAADSSLGTMVGTPEIPSYLATDVVANGSMIVGTTRWPGFLPVAKEMFRWGADGFEELGMMPGGSYSWADAVSADGSVIVGYGDFDGHLAAARWTKETGVQPLPGLPNAIVASQASGVSPDGSIIVGFLGQDAIRWTKRDGIVSLGHFKGAGWAHALDLSADGSVIVGYNYFDKPGPIAFIWTQRDGMQPLQEVLSDAGVDLKGWALRYAMGVSDDGRAIVGWGDNPAGEPEAFLVQISQPEDLNGDGHVDGFDLALLLGQWGMCVGCLAPVTPPIPCPADLNGDCQVNGFDLAILLAAWG